MAIGKAALGQIVSGDPIVEVNADNLILSLRKLEPGRLKDAEFNFPIPDGSTVSLVLPANLPAELQQKDSADVQMVQHRAEWDASERLLSFPVSLAVSPARLSSVQGIDFGEEEVFITIPFNATSLNSEDVNRVYRGEGISCVTWQEDGADIHEGSRWTSRGCRVETVRVALDAAGQDVFGLGSVVCACSHMSTYALSFREEPVRFEDPTPESGDLLVVTAGHQLHLRVKAVATGDKLLTLSRLTISPNTSSFVPPTLSVNGASSAVQAQRVPGMTIVNASVSWTPMLSGSFTMSLSLFAGKSRPDIYCVVICMPKFLTP